MNGILNVNKPASVTSSAVVYAVRKMLGTRDVGHMGTLDPQGTGVLLLGVGKATRLFDFFLKKDKVYRAEFTFGYETDTLDGDGQITDTRQIYPDQADILLKLPLLCGAIQQLPPKYSAKNINGERAYALMRKGIDVHLQPSPVEIYNIKLLKKTKEHAYLFEIHCSGGTYIRSLCRDLAYSLGTLATMTGICRTKCGKFRIEDAKTPDEINLLKENALIPFSETLNDLPRLDIDANLYDKLRNGVKLTVSENPKFPFTVYCRNELFGLGRINEEGYLRIKSYLKED